MKAPNDLQERARNIRLIAMDVDGVLTGGEIIVLDSGEEMKIWNVKDRFGFHLARRAGADVKFAWITGRESNQVAARAAEIGIDAVYQNCMTKDVALKEIVARFGCSPAEAVFIGDDLVDIPAFRVAGLAVAPPDAPVEVRDEADYITRVRGGRGVLREVVELVLKARGLWQEAVKGYL